MCHKMHSHRCGLEPIPLTYANDLLRHASEGKTSFGLVLDVISLLLFTMVFLSVGTKLHFKFRDWAGLRKKKR